MDRVRLGRALGYGARHAVRSLAQAAEAVSAPAASPRAGTAGSAGTPAAAPLAQRVRQAAGQARRQKGAVLAPLRRFSGVLWLEVTGVFFALIAVALSRVAWTMRATILHAPGSLEAKKAYLALGVTALFAYFAVSSFVRARRRERR